MENTKDRIKNEIFGIEAKGLLQDLMLNTVLVQYHKDMDINKMNQIIDYIKNIFKKYDKLKQIHLLTDFNSHTLCGYSLSFIHNESNSLYLHKIYVQEAYRKKGIGTKILKELQSYNCKITLLCSKKTEQFYIKNKFYFIESFPISKYEDYKLSRKIYNGLSIMSNINENNNVPIFLLKDIDINNIANILKYNKA